MKNLVKEYLKRKFFEDKDTAINEYMAVAQPMICMYNYTSGKVVIIDLAETKAYSRNGYLFSVILKNDSYIEYVLENKKEEVIQYLDNALASKYENADGVDVEEEEKESE